ncbi:MAG: HEAT repeat domain-containing protein [archaeon]|jgi:hypothetical protein
MHISSKAPRQVKPWDPHEFVLTRAPAHLKPVFEKLVLGASHEKYLSAVHLGQNGSKKLVPLYRALAKSPNPKIAAEGIVLVGAFGTRKDLPFLNKLMYSEDPYLRYVAIDVLALRKDPRSLQYLMHRLKTADLKTRKECIRAIALYKPRDYELYSFLSESKEFKDPTRKVKIASQVKDGSTTVLLGGKFYDKVIIRGGPAVREFGELRIPYAQGIKPEALEAWKKALEFDWKSLGLDHNPIEPILKKKGKYRIFKNKDGTYRASVGVIQGESAHTFMRKHIVPAPLHDELQHQINTITEGLNRLQINHSHDHLGNFVIKIVEGKPQVFLIDFDAAVFGKPKLPPVRI